VILMKIFFKKVNCPTFAQGWYVGAFWHIVLELQ